MSDVIIVNVVVWWTLFPSLYHSNLNGAAPPSIPQVNMRPCPNLWYCFGWDGNNFGASSETNENNYFCYFLKILTSSKYRTDGGYNEKKFHGWQSAANFPRPYGINLEFARDCGQIGTKDNTWQSKTNVWFLRTTTSSADRSGRTLTMTVFAKSGFKSRLIAALLPLDLCEFHDYLNYYFPL